MKNSYEMITRIRSSMYMINATLATLRIFTFFEVNTKYISLSVLKTSEFSQVHSTRERSDVFNSRDEIYLVFTKKW